MVLGKLWVLKINHRIDGGIFINVIRKCLGCGSKLSKGCNQGVVKV